MTFAFKNGDISAKPKQMGLRGGDTFRHYDQIQPESLASEYDHVRRTLENLVSEYDYGKAKV